MTYTDVIGQIDLFKPNSYTFDEKRAWLKRLEKKIETEIIATHEGDYLIGDVTGDGKIDGKDAELVNAYTKGNAELNFGQLKAADAEGDGDVDYEDARAIGGYENGYISELPAEEAKEELFVGMPYDELYLRWLEAQIDYHNGEIERYNNSITAFNSAYSAFERYYNRTHLPKGVQPGYF
ncbi:MAG: dockerin type I repeat-containing protein [Oscillospiraceae bacterium]|nr:dockerin type I repeat-containing protein [Oscillospiraceae bacterium]